MNIVIFGKGLGKPRQFSLSGPLAAAAILLFAGIISAVGFAGGHWYAAATGSGVSSDELVGLNDELQREREQDAGDVGIGVEPLDRAADGRLAGGRRQRADLVLDAPALGSAALAAQVRRGRFVLADAKRDEPRVPP